MADIDEVIAEFEAKMKAVSPEDMQMAKGETPAAVAVEEEGLPACVGKGFKQLVQILPDSYIGENIKDLLVEFVGFYPECEV